MALRWAEGKERTGLVGLLFLASLNLALGILFSAPALADPLEQWVPPKCGSEDPVVQCRLPRGIAANEEDGHVFIADQKNHRIVELNARGEFVEAWGKDVTQGGGTGFEVCVYSAGDLCKAGISGTGPGEFNNPAGISLDSAGNVYVADVSNRRVQKFDEGGDFVLMFGGDVVTNGAAGTGIVSNGSTLITSVATTSKIFKVGQTIEGLGIEPGTVIAAVASGSITLSQPAGPAATGSVTGITTPAGVNNVPNNEKQTVSLGGNTVGGTFTLSYTTPTPSNTSATTSAVPFDASAAELEAQLQALANIGSGSVAVTGAAGGPWEVEFKGTRFADTDVNQMTANAGGLVVSEGKRSVLIASARVGEVCDIALECQAGTQGVGVGQFGAWAFGDSIAVNLDDVYVGDANRIQHFSVDGDYLDEITVAGNTVQALADDVGGNLYVAFENKPDIQKLDSSGSVVGSFELPIPGEVAVNIPSAVTVDDTGHVYAFGATSCCGSLHNLNPIIEFDATGKIIDEFGKGQFDTSFGLAANLCSGSELPGNLYATNGSETTGFVRAYGTEPIGCLKARTLAASPVGEFAATLNGTVNPKGEAVAECFFEWGVDEEYGQTAPCVPGATEIGSGSEPVPVHADIGSLPKAAIHHFRLIAEVGGETEVGADESFKTLGPPVISADHAVDATEDEAQLKALVNPEGFATSCNFDYGTGEAYELSTAAQAIGKDGDRADHVLAAVIPGLATGTTYHWRVSCSNSSGAVAAPDHILDTYRTFGMEDGCANDAFRVGPSALLPDCRGYEMVSPVDKNGGNILLPSDGNVQSSPDGDRITYNAIPSFGDAASSLVVNQYMASREGGGWPNHAIHPPAVGRIVQPGIPVLGLVRDFITFTPDLCYAWLFDYLRPSLTPAGQPDFADYYRRDNCEPGEGDLEALTASPPTVPEGTPPDYIEPTWVQGASDDALHAIFLAKTALTPDAAVGDSTQIYDHFGGANHLVSVLPTGNASTTSNEVGSGWFRSLDNAVSADGSRVYWIEGSSVTSGIGRLFLRLHPEQGKVPGECSDPATACTLPVSSGKEAFFWTASEDGARALYTERTETTPPKLLEFDQGEGTPAKRLISENVEGVLGAARDLSRIYFVSREKLTEEALEGEPNIYLDQPGPLTYVTTLGDSDVLGGAAPYDLAADELRLRTARVSADGSRLVFQSRAQLTGYDNTDQVNDKADVEVFAYEVGGELECISCNPSGARPVGRELRKRYWSNDGGGHGVFAAAWIPAPEHPLHASNVVSADGNRIFFNSNDALLPRDTNSTMDVYEWEAAGTGSCTDAKDNSSYFPQNGGCLYLISTGESPFESEFWEADADGSDVFFTTESKLVSSDPGLVDLYDARVDGGFAEPAPVPDCEGEACQSPASPPVFSAPSSRTYSGPGNPPKAGKTCSGGKRKVRRKGKVRCVQSKRHAHEKRRQRRAGQDRGARR